MCHTTTAALPAADTASAPSPSPADGAAETTPSSAAQALAKLRTSLDWLTAADATSLTGAERADVLRALAAAESVQLAATAKVLSAFDAAEDYAADGQGGPQAWLRWQARMTRPAAGAAMAWARRLAAHQQVAAALAAGAISVSYARRICDWVEVLPADVRDAAEGIMVRAAVAGADLDGLAALFEEIRVRTARPDADGDDDGFDDRAVLLDTYYRGNGSLRGDLTPPAAAALRAVLDSLNDKTGPGDMRSRAQRDHDALEEACRLLLAARCLPVREGQPVQIQLQMTLSQLLGQPEADPALAADIAARGAPAPPGADCDAQIVPIVTGTVDQDLLADLAAGYRGATGPASAATSDSTERRASDADASAAELIGSDGDQTLARARRAAAGLTITDALRLLSGPGGLAAQLRSRLTLPAGAVSLPLDIGAATDTIPVHIRRAVTRRDQHCRFPGCDQPPVRCHVHHLRPRADGGETALTNCCLLCTFHHLIAVHRRGWTLRLNPDGTTTATSPDGKRVLHSHAPPTAA